MNTEKLTTVTVVGAGPVGMVAALSLHRLGIPVTLMEAEDDSIRSEWRGSTLHPPTLEIFDDLGIAGPILSDGVRLTRMVYRDLEIQGEASFDYSLLSPFTRFPFRIQYEQFKVIRHLKEALIREGVPTFYQHALAEVTQSDSGVLLTVMTPDGPREFSTRWLVAADGAHSTVRNKLNIDFPGFTYPTQSLVVATSLDLEAIRPDLPPVCYWTGPSGRFSTIRTPDIWRVAISTDVSSDREGQHKLGDSPHPSFLSGMKLLVNGVVDVSNIELLQHQFYRSHQRLADAFRVGRVVLAGDAAHLSSTTGGMGLNTGIHDAHQLAKAFASSELDSSLSMYSNGRRQVAQELVQPQTTANRQGTDLLSPSERSSRLDNLIALAADKDSARQHLYKAAMLGASGLDLDKT